jgi:hypothetical protein
MKPYETNRDYDRLSKDRMPLADWRPARDLASGTKPADVLAVSIDQYPIQLTTLPVRLARPTLHS